MSERIQFIENTHIVVFGASGDLAKKKTFPALFGLYREGKLSNTTRIVGFARSSITTSEFKDRLKPFFKLIRDGDDKLAEEFLDLVSYKSAPYDEPEGFQSLEKDINESDLANGVMESHRLYYLALPPSVFTQVARMLKAHCHPGDKGIARLIVEKPFGHDLNSARELQRNLAPLWNEDELFRIDHYLGKEMVKNLIPVRFANPFLNASWSNQRISSIQISFKEPFGTEGRGGYFDNIGIIRDVIQNHLLQVLSIILMERPVNFTSEAIRDEKVRLLKAIQPLSGSDVLVGQYDKSEDGSKPGYLDDKTVKTNSKAVTYAAIPLCVSNERWEGVPIILRAGKALNQGKVEIRIQYKEVKSGIFEHSSRNELVMRIQPDEAMYLKMNIKVPGSNEVSTSELDLTYKDRYSAEFYIPEAYESLIKDVLDDDHSNFVRDDELDISWALFTPLLEYIEGPEGPNPVKYPYGSRGPASLNEFLANNGYVYNKKKRYQWPVATPETINSSKF